MQHQHAGMRARSLRRRDDDEDLRVIARAKDGPPHVNALRRGIGGGNLAQDLRGLAIQIRSERIRRLLRVERAWHDQPHAGEKS